MNVRVPKQITAQEQAARDVERSRLNRLRLQREQAVNQVIIDDPSHSSHSSEMESSTSSSYGRTSKQRKSRYVKKDRQKNNLYQDGSTSRKARVNDSGVGRTKSRNPKYKQKEVNVKETESGRRSRKTRGSERKDSKYQVKDKKQKTKKNRTTREVVIDGCKFFVSKKNGLLYDKDAFRYPDTTENITEVGTILDEMELPIDCIVDAFAGCGGDLNGLCAAMGIHTAHAFEINKRREQVLTRNVRVDNFNHYNTEHVMRDEFLSGMLYLDPVWDEYYKDHVQDLMMCNYPYVLLKNKGHSVVKYPGYRYKIVKKFVNKKGGKGKDVKWLYVLYILDTKSISIIEDDVVDGVCPYIGNECTIDIDDGIYTCSDYVENRPHTFGKNRKNYMLDVDAVSVMLRRAGEQSKDLALVYIGSGNPRGGSLLHMKHYLDANKVFVISVDVRECMSGYLRIDTPITIDNVYKISDLVTLLSKLNYYVGLLFDMRTQEDDSVGKKGNPSLDEDYRFKDLHIIEALDTCGFDMCSFKIADFWCADHDNYENEIVRLRLESFTPSPYMSKNSEGRIITSTFSDYVDIDVVNGNCEYSINNITLGGLAFKHRCGGCYSCDFFERVCKIHPYNDFVLPIRNQDVYTLDDVGKIAVLAVPSDLRTIYHVEEVEDVVTNIVMILGINLKDVHSMLIIHDELGISLPFSKWNKLKIQFTQSLQTDQSSLSSSSSFDSYDDVSIDDVSETYNDNDIVENNEANILVTVCENGLNDGILDYSGIASFLDSS
jgi:hypothetical protein